MTTTELKKKLISEINSIDNEMLLEEMLRLAGASEEEESIYHLSDLQLDAVKESQAQFKKGDYLTDSEANNEIDEWLDK